MRALIVAAVVGLVLAACSPLSGGSSGRITATADFVDVNSLEHHATVELNGITVGTVSHIQVDGPLAKLTMSLKKSASIPANVVADIRQDSLLGPDVVELSVPPGPAAPPLADHAVIADAAHPGKFQPDFESLVKSGNDLLTALGAAGTSALARIIDEQARGFGPEGGDLRVVLDDLNTVVSGYATRSTTLSTLLQKLDTFASTLGPNAQANAQALSNLANTTAALDRQKDRLIDLLQSLSNLGAQGADLLHADLGAITDQFAGLRSVTQALANQQSALARILVYVYGHNVATARGVSRPDDFVQVLNQFIVCGIPNGGDVPGSPTNSCYDSGTGKP